ncbi:MAG: DNA-binding response regulator [Denitrovibrio sp.]|nr:MAG: DNA-binding response regulator [Denitrovibrio sp.]
MSVFLLDDHAVLRESLCILMNKETDMNVCGTASDVADAVSKLFKVHADIIIVDLSLENSNGMDFIKTIKARYEDIRVIVLSMHDELVFAERCLRSGADGYIMKSEKPSVLLSAIRQVMNGKIYLSEKMIQYIVAKSMNQKNASEKDVVESLSDREFQVFQYIGEGYLSKQMADFLNLSVKTIDSLRENIKHKLGLENASELTRYAIKWVHSKGIL